MTLQKKPTASEWTKNLVKSILYGLVPKGKRGALGKQIGIPLELAKEMHDFVERNEIVEGRCCEQCLKAHALKEAKNHFQT